MELHWKNVLIPPETTVRQSLHVLDSGGLRLAMVVDHDGRLLGTVTDGDIRRGLLNKIDLDAPVGAMMNAHPRTATQTQSREAIRSIMERHSLLHVPIVDAQGQVVGLETYHHLTAPPLRDSWVFFMAGGFGTRLRPLTNDCPKPMLPVRGKPILENILESFIAAGFSKFYVSVHYLAHLIKDHFGNGERWGVTIRYVDEESPLGTAGALGLLPEIDNLPVIVMNGDVLTQLDFNSLLDFHVDQQAALTLCVREYDMQVPFGVVEGTESRVTRIVEKPTHSFFVNAGIYVIAPKVVAASRPARRLDMPDLVQQLIDSGEKVAMFPVHEYWLDIGRPDDFALAQTGQKS